MVEAAPHPQNYPLNALISHAFGEVPSLTQYNESKRVNLLVESMKRQEAEEAEQNALHFYENRPTDFFSTPNNQQKAEPAAQVVFPQDATPVVDPHSSSEFTQWASLLFSGLEKTLDTTQKTLESRLNSQDEQLEKIQKQVENLAYDSGLVDLYNESE